MQNRPARVVGEADVFKAHACVQPPDSKPRSLGDLTFITARPADLLGWVEDQTRKKLRGAGVSVSSMLTGSMLHLLSHAGMAEKKIQNITHYHALFPEYRLVFIGDPGRGTRGFPWRAAADRVRRQR